MNIQICHVLIEPIIRLKGSWIKTILRERLFLIFYYNEEYMDDSAPDESINIILILEKYIEKFFYC